MLTDRVTFPGSSRQPYCEPRQDDSSRTAPTPSRRDSILLGDSVAIRTVRSQVQRIAPHFRVALVLGEPGTGKELIARALHGQSPVSDGPFVVANASALAGEAHTSAALLESAQGGMLYLEGIGELSFLQQSTLTRLLEVCDERRAAGLRTGAIRPSSRTAEARIVAETHRDLRTLAAIGQFRQDLYMRLSAVEMTAPPLRQRAEDIPMLSGWMLRRIAEPTGLPPKVLADATIAQLQHRPWTNNLIDLKRALTQAAALAEGPVIEPRHLLALVEAPAQAALAAAPTKVERLQDVIHRHVVEVLTRCGGNKLRAAELLGISRSTLYRMLDATSVQPLA